MLISGEYYFSILPGCPCPFPMAFEVGPCSSCGWLASTGSLTLACFLARLLASRKYPKIVDKVIEEDPIQVPSEDDPDVFTSIPVDLSGKNPNGQEFDNLYLDVRSSLHPEVGPRLTKFVCSHVDERYCSPLYSSRGQGACHQLRDETREWNVLTTRFAFRPDVSLSPPISQPAPETEQDMMLEIFAYTERVVSMVRPRKLLFMAIGASPSRLI